MHVYGTRYTSVENRRRAEITKQQFPSLTRDTSANATARERGVCLALKEYYSAKERYITSKKSASSGTGSRSFNMSASSLSITSRISTFTVSLAPLSVPLLVYALRISYLKGCLYLAATASALVLLLTLVCERRIHSMRLYQQRWTTCPPTLETPPSQVTFSTEAPEAQQHDSQTKSSQITTVPWQHARGPRIRQESMSRRRSEEQRIRRAARQPAGRSTNANFSQLSGIDQAKCMAILRSGISEVQVVPEVGLHAWDGIACIRRCDTAADKLPAHCNRPVYKAGLYGEPAKGEFSAERMWMEEIALEVNRLACTVGLEPQDPQAGAASQPSLLLQKLAEIRELLGLS